MRKVFQWRNETRWGARLVARLVIALIFLIVFSAVALASGKRPGASGFAVRQAASFEPTKSPTYARPARPIATSASALSSQSSFSPQTIIGQPQVDAYTVALYHFDSQIGNDTPDAGGQYTATLYGGASVFTPGLYGGALQLNGNGSYVKISNLPPLPVGTIEAFVDFASVCSGLNVTGDDLPIFAFGGDYGSYQSVAELVRPSWYLDFNVLTASKWLTATSGINPCRYLKDTISVDGYTVWPYEAWRYHHVAATWGPRGTEVWVDGVLHGVGTTDFDISGINNNYMCNPQLQVTPWPNPPYPICSTPVPVRTAVPGGTPVGAPPGDYFGGIPSFTTLLIGCNALQVCIHGHIDEVRISNIQRTFSPSVDPTSTPTATQTPVPITAEYPVDPYTAALFHLNSQSGSSVYEEKTQAWRQLAGAAAVVPAGRFNSGLALDGTNSFLIMTSNGSPFGPLSIGTLETWVNFSDSSRNHTLFAARQYYNSPSPLLSLTGIANGPIRFSITDNQTNPSLDSDVSVASLVGCWHHVAGTFGPRGMEIWIDGSLHSANGFTGGTLSQIYSWQVGGDFGSSCQCTKGTIDEVRVSNIQRVFTSQAPQFRPLIYSPLASGTLTFQPFIRRFGCTYGP